MEPHFLKLTCSASVICSQVPKRYIFFSIRARLKKKLRLLSCGFPEPGSTLHDSKFILKLTYKEQTITGRRDGRMEHTLDFIICANLILQASLSTLPQGKFIWILLQTWDYSHGIALGFSGTSSYFLSSTVFIYPQCPGEWSAKCVWPAAQKLSKWCCANTKHYLETEHWRPYWII